MQKRGRFVQVQGFEVVTAHTQTALGIWRIHDGGFPRSRTTIIDAPGEPRLP